jgi:hypothetical protein
MMRDALRRANRLHADCDGSDAYLRSWVIGEIALVVAAGGDVDAAMSMAELMSDVGYRLVIRSNLAELLHRQGRTAAARDQLCVCVRECRDAEFGRVVPHEILRTIALTQARCGFWVDAVVTALLVRVGRSPLVFEIARRHCVSAGSHIAADNVRQFVKAEDRAWGLLGVAAGLENPTRP